MYNFRNMEDSFNICVRHTLPDSSFHLYSAKVDLTSSRKNSECYHFKLLKRHDVLVDDNVPQIASDIAMQEIGDNLYPIELSVASTGGIFDVENFAEIKDRWTNKRKELSEKYPTFEFDQYLQASAHNMDDKRQFLNILKRDAFVQFYFMPTDRDVVTFDLHHFPLHGYIMKYYGAKIKKDAVIDGESYAILPLFKDEKTQKTDGTLYCKQSLQGDNTYFELNISLLMADQTSYNRNVLLTRDESYKRVVNLWIH